MNYIIKLQNADKYYQGTICGEHHFSSNIDDALKFKNEKTAKGTIKYHSLSNVSIQSVN